MTLNDQPTATCTCTYRFICNLLRIWTCTYRHRSVKGEYPLIFFSPGIGSTNSVGIFNRPATGRKQKDSSSTRNVLTLVDGHHQSVEKRFLNYLIKLILRIDQYHIIPISASLSLQQLKHTIFIQADTCGEDGEGKHSI